MAHEILSVKLCELEEQLSRLSGRIHLSETAGHDQLRREIRALSKECEETEWTYGAIEQLIQKTKSELETQAAGREGGEAAAEEKILLAEYALDFALEAANRALLLSMEAIDTQLTSQEQERSLS